MPADTGYRGRVTDPDSYKAKEHDGKAENAQAREGAAANDVQRQLDAIDKGDQGSAPSDYQGESKLFRRSR